MSSAGSEDFMQDPSVDSSDGGSVVSVVEQMASLTFDRTSTAQPSGGLETSAAKPCEGYAASDCSDDIMCGEDADASDGTVDFEFHQPKVPLTPEEKALRRAKFEASDPVRLCALGKTKDPFSVARTTRKTNGYNPVPLLRASRSSR